jgi:hypothetical protein
MASFSDIAEKYNITPDQLDNLLSGVSDGMFASGIIKCDFPGCWEVDNPDCSWMTDSQFHSCATGKYRCPGLYCHDHLTEAECDDGTVAKFCYKCVEPKD